MLNRIEKTLHRTTAIAEWVGNVLLSGMVLLIVADIILRYSFNRPLGYSTELVEFALGILVFLGIVACTSHRGHVKIDILLMRLPRRGQAAVNSFFYFFAAVIFGLMTWQAVLNAMQSQELGIVSAMLKLPYQPFILVMALCTLLIGLLFLLQLIQFVIETVRK